MIPHTRVYTDRISACDKYHQVFDVNGTRFPYWWVETYACVPSSTLTQCSDALLYSQ